MEESKRVFRRNRVGRDGFVVILALLFATAPIAVGALRRRGNEGSTSGRADAKARALGRSAVAATNVAPSEVLERATPVAAVVENASPTPTSAQPVAPADDPMLAEIDAALREIEAAEQAHGNSLIVPGAQLPTEIADPRDKIEIARATQPLNPEARAVHDEVAQRIAELKQRLVREHKSSRHLKGSVHLAFLVDRHGRISAARIRRSSVSDPMIAAALMQNVRSWHLPPPTAKPLRVHCQLRF